MLEPQKPIIMGGKTEKVIGMNHACFSVKFSVFFITKMHDSRSFSLILR